MQTGCKALRRTSQIGVLENVRDLELSTLEAVSIGAGGYVVTTELLGGSTLEGLVVGGATFVVVKGGSKLVRWLF